MDKKMKKVAVVSLSLSPWEEFWKECDEKGSPRVRNAGKGGGGTRTLCTELAGDNTVISKEAWARDGEDPETEVTETGIFDCDSDRDPRDPENHHIETENLCEEDIYPDRYDDDDDDQEWRETKRRDPKAMLMAAKSLLRLLYGAADDSVSMEEFESLNPIIAIYLRERMDGVVRHFFKNLRDEHITETVLDFVRKMVLYKPAVSQKEKNHILPHARIERHEMNALRKKIQHAEISSQAKARLISRVQREQSRPGYRGANPNDNCHVIRLGRALFGKDRFGRMLRV